MMPASTLNLPDIQARLSNSMRIFNSAAASVIDFVTSGRRMQDAEGSYARLVELLRSVDDLLGLLQTDGLDEDGEWADITAMAHALRSAAYLALTTAFPDEAVYWSVENQARIRELDAAVTPEARAEWIQGALEDDARLREDPRVLAAMQEELALWDTTVADGIGAD